MTKKKLSEAPDFNDSMSTPDNDVKISDAPHATNKATQPISNGPARKMNDSIQALAKIDRILSKIHPAAARRICIWLEDNYVRSYAPNQTIIRDCVAVGNKSGYELPKEERRPIPVFKSDPIEVILNETKIPASNTDPNNI